MSIVIDAAISLFLTALGIAFGMDKAHNFTDFVGPILLAAGSIYAFWCGFTILGVFISLIFLVKILFR